MTEDEFLIETGLKIHKCIACGILYAMPNDFLERRKKDHKTFYCPNGHTVYFPTKTEEEVRIGELESDLRFCKLNRNLLEEENKQHDYQARYYKGRLAKMKKAQVEI